jgi:CheY-like chemotaxis protein
MLERHTDPARRAATMEAMRHAVERGAGLTRQLLAFSRRQTLRFETIYVPRQLHTMRELLERSLRADILVDFALPEGLWPVRTDPAQFELAIINLAVNARDAMPKGGLISFTARNVDHAPDKGEGHFVEIAIRDTGVGIPPDVLSRVFEPYFTTKQVGQGTGLGLSQVYGFALQSGGSITVDSTVNEGTCVRLYLPRAEAGENTQEPETPTATPAPPPSARILVVEDDDAVAAFVAEMLSHLGYSHVRAANAPDALESLARDSSFDLVFSDIVMPGGMHGEELATEIRRRWPNLPIVLTTGYSGAPNVGAGFPLLRKPYQLSELEAILSATLSRERKAASG